MKLTTLLVPPLLLQSTRSFVASGPDWTPSIRVSPHRRALVLDGFNGSSRSRAPTDTTLTARMGADVSQGARPGGPWGLPATRGNRETPAFLRKRASGPESSTALRAHAKDGEGEAPARRFPSNLFARFAQATQWNEQKVRTVNAEGVGPVALRHGTNEDYEMPTAEATATLPMPIDQALAVMMDSDHASERMDMPVVHDLFQSNGDDAEVVGWAGVVRFPSPLGNQAGFFLTQFAREGDGVRIKTATVDEQTFRRWHLSTGVGPKLGETQWKAMATDIARFDKRLVNGCNEMRLQPTADGRGTDVRYSLGVTPSGTGSFLFSVAPRSMKVSGAEDAAFDMVKSFGIYTDKVPPRALQRARRFLSPDPAVS